MYYEVSESCIDKIVDNIGKNKTANLNESFLAKTIYGKYKALYCGEKKVIAAIYDTKEEAEQFLKGEANGKFN